MESVTDEQHSISNVNLQNTKLKTLIKSEIYYNYDEVLNNRCEDNVWVKEENLCTSPRYDDVYVKDELENNLLQASSAESFKSTEEDDTKQIDDSNSNSVNLSNNTASLYTSKLKIVCGDNSDTDDELPLSLPNKNFTRTGRNVCKDDKRDEVYGRHSTSEKPIISHSDERQYSNNERNFIAHSEQAHDDVTAPTIPPVPQIPANVDYAGELDFDILINPNDTASRTSWIYSQLLNKLFIKIETILPVDVKRNVLPHSGDLFLRATLLYSLPQFAGELIARCSVHVAPTLQNNRDIEPHITRHVLRCTNPAPIYLGDADIKQHLSVITRLEEPQAGMETVRVNYQFMCKNSCPTGMNRRAVDVIFTLEDACSRVLGRRKLNVRICSCPKRDRDKEENEFTKQQGVAVQKQGRKRKHNKCLTHTSNIPDATSVVLDDRLHTDNLLYRIPMLEVIGRDVAIDTLRFAQDRMIGELERGRYGDDEKYRALVRGCINNITVAMKNLTPR